MTSSHRSERQSADAIDRNKIIPYFRPTHGKQRRQGSEFRFTFLLTKTTFGPSDAQGRQEWGLLTGWRMIAQEVIKDLDNSATNTETQNTISSPDVISSSNPLCTAL